MTCGIYSYVMYDTQTYVTDNVHMSMCTYVAQSWSVLNSIFLGTGQNQQSAIVWTISPVIQ